MESVNSNNADFKYSADRSEFPPVTPLAMAYVPFQKFQTVYDAQAALAIGTIFPELDKPWLGGRALALRQGTENAVNMAQQNDNNYQSVMAPENRGGANFERSN